MTTTKTKEIELSKEANGLLYTLTGELEVTLHETNFNEENPAYQIEEVDRELLQSWFVICELRSNKIIWDAPATKPQLDFFEDEINDIEYEN